MDHFLGVFDPLPTPPPHVDSFIIQALLVKWIFYDPTWFVDDPGPLRTNNHLGISKTRLLLGKLFGNVSFQMLVK